MKIHSSLLLLLGVATAALPLPSEAAIKCWTNRDGIRECGNSIPPEYSQKESKTINEQGIVTEVKRGALTPEELAAEQRKVAAEAEQKAEAERRQSQQEAYDRMLMATYLTEEDILKAKNRNIGVVDGYIDSALYTIEKLQQNLDLATREAANLERQGKSVNENLLKKIESIRLEMANREEYVVGKRQERDEISRKYEAEMQRFRQLKSGEGLRKE